MDDKEELTQEIIDATTAKLNEELNHTNEYRDICKKLAHLMEIF